MGGVFWHAAVFGLAPILRRIASLVLLPLYTHYLTPRDYGEIEVLTIATGLVALVLRLELRPAYMRAWLTGDPDGHDALFGSTTRLLGVLGAAGALLFVAGAGPLSAWLLGEPIGWLYRVLLGVGIFAEVASLVFHATLQAQLRSGAMVALGVAQFVVGTVLTIVCVVGLHSGPIGVFAGGVVAQVLGLLAMAVLTRRPAHGGRGAGMAPIGPLLRYSLPLLGTALLFFVVRSADRIAVAQLLSVAELGVYAMAWTLANLLMTVVFLPLQTSLDVWRHRLFMADDGAARFAEVFRVAMLVMGAAAAGLMTAGVDLFLRVADPSFGPAAAMVPALCVAVVLQAGYSIVASAFFVTGQTAWWSVLFAAAAAVQVGASVGAVMAFGLPGAPVGIVIANALLYAGAAIWGRRLWAVPYRHGTVVAIVLLLPAVAAGRWALPLDGAGLLARLLADAAMCAAFAAALFATGAARPGDVVALRGLVLDRAAAGWRRLAGARA